MSLPLDKNISIAMTRKAKHIWVQYGALILCCIYAAVSFLLMCLKHDAFNTRIYDFARFSQALWTTLHGRFLFSSLHYGSILGNHFSPLMALYAPLLWLWDNPRVIFLAQAVNAAACVFFIQLIIRDQRPKLAPWFTLIALLNPVLHDVTLFEVRRIVFGMPFFGLALYALHKKKKVLLVVNLLFALMAKESMGIYVFMIGFYLLVFEKDWRWGSGLMAFGAGWSIVVSLWVIPAIRSNGSTLSVYPQLYYYEHLGSTYSEIFSYVIRYPIAVLRMMFQAPQLKALFRILLPFGFVLPFLHPQWVMFCVPYVALMFLSTDIDMIQLDKWYMATVFPVFLASTAAGWFRVPRKWEKRLLALFLVFTWISFVLYSSAPLGGRYDAHIYSITSRNRIESAMIKQVPDNACVVAQNHYVPHLTHRLDLYHYPIVRDNICPITYYLFDRSTNAHPADHRDINALIDSWLPDPSMTVEAEAEDIYLFRMGGDSLPVIEVNAVAENTMHLVRAEVARTDEDGVFTNTTMNPLSLQRGQKLRVYLYWEALGAPGRERSVSVRIMDASDSLIAQHDSMPGGGSKPTSWWEEGWHFRDIYYLEIPNDAPLGDSSLELVLYDTYSFDVVPFDNGQHNLLLRQMTIRE